MQNNTSIEIPFIQSIRKPFSSVTLPISCLLIGLAGILCTLAVPALKNEVIYYICCIPTAVIVVGGVIAYFNAKNGDALKVCGLRWLAVGAFLNTLVFIFLFGALLNLTGRLPRHIGSFNDLIFYNISYSLYHVNKAFIWIEALALAGGIIFFFLLTVNAFRLIKSIHQGVPAHCFGVIIGSSLFLAAIISALAAIYTLILGSTNWLFFVGAAALAVGLAFFGNVFIMLHSASKDFMIK